MKTLEQEAIEATQEFHRLYEVVRIAQQKQVGSEELKAAWDELRAFKGIAKAAWDKLENASRNHVRRGEEGDSDE